MSVLIGLFECQGQKVCPITFWVLPASSQSVLCCLYLMDTEERKKIQTSLTLSSRRWKRQNFLERAVKTKVCNKLSRIVWVLCWSWKKIWKGQTTERTQQEGSTLGNLLVLWSRNQPKLWRDNNEEPHRTRNSQNVSETEKKKRNNYLYRILSEPQSHLPPWHQK